MNTLCTHPAGRVIHLGSGVLLLLVLAAAARAALVDDAWPEADVRLRGYHVDAASSFAPSGDTTEMLPGDGGDEFGDVRIRLGVHGVSWSQSSWRMGWRGTGAWDSEAVEDSFENALGESWVKWENPGFTPLTLTAGRQFAEYGDGRLVSTGSDEWGLDGLRVVYDALPFKADLLFAYVVHWAPDTDIDRLVWGSLSYEGESVMLHGIEWHAGLFELKGDGAPRVVGADLVLLRNAHWTCRAGGDYEDGDGPGGRDVSAWAAAAQMERRFAAPAFRPVFRAGWAYASGDRNPDGKEEFVTLLNDESWGRVFAPRYGNLHVFSVALSGSFSETLSAELRFFLYEQDKARAEAVGDPRLNNGGYAYAANGTDRELGSEAGLTVTYRASEWLTLEIFGGRFFTGDAYEGVEGSEDAAELSCEASVRF